ncbi:MAG: hypothetical protein QM731_05810 [Chitinophagaceae bacterium]
MREIYYNSDITPKAINEIKLLALYYDRINIVNDAVYSPKFDMVDGEFKFTGTDTLQFIPNSFTSDYKLLINEGLISITQKKEEQENEYEKKLTRKISDLVNSHQDLIFPSHPKENNGKIITEEVYDIMKYMLDFEWNKPIETDFIWWYYAFKLKWFIKLLIDGKNCLSSSNNLNNLFSAFIQDSTKTNQNLGIKGYTKSLAFDALKISLPNPDLLSFEDILELKLKLKDQLAFFYQTINSIEVKNKELFTSDIKENDYQAIFFNEIEKPHRELELKMKNLNSKTFRNFIEKIKDPKSYAPLIGTVVASLPIHYTLLASLGLTTSQSYSEYREEKREIENNGLYFLLKLR